jgi:hypothetical protein
MFIRDIGAISPPEAIDFADEAQGLADEFDLDEFTVFVGGQFGMELSPCIHIFVRDLNIFDLLKIEEPLAIHEGMETIHSQRRLVRLDNGKRKHGGVFPP